MKIPRDLSGGELITKLCRNWDYSVVHRVGSHVILETGTPGHQRIAIPNHTVLKIGTLHAILRSVAMHKNVTRETVLSDN